MSAIVKSVVWGLLIILVAFTVSAGEQGLVINEVAWGGSRENRAGEWIELYNTSGEAIDLEGWSLASADGSPEIFLVGTINPLQTGSDLVGGYYLLERNDDNAVPGIKADQIYTGALNDGGEALSLINPEGRVVDTANRGGGPWLAGGTNGDSPCTMERIDPTVPDDPANWASSIPLQDEEGASGAPSGTPRAANSVFNIPPNITFSIDPDPRFIHPEQVVLFDASDSFDRSGTIISYIWDFGDKLSGEGQTTSHTYAKSGIYTVSLAVKDDRGGMNKQSTQVRVLSELISVDFSVKPTSQSRIMQSQDELLFLDESYDPDGTIVAWNWSFGDEQTDKGRNVTHTYTHGESYLVTLCVTNTLGETACQTQIISIVSRKPVASFTSSPALPNKGEDVSFDATGSFDLDGTIVHYDWDFDGDGTIDLSIDQPVTVHQFTVEGEHAVTLRVSDDSNMVSLPFSGTVTINWEPIAAFQVSNFYPAELEEVTFTDCSHDRDGEITARHWDFGDGNSSDLPSPTHSYLDDGIYTIVLTVTDGNGAHGTVHAVITAQNLPPIAHIETVVKGGKVHTYAPVTFDGSASTDQSPNGQIVLYEWDLGADGTYEESSTSPTFAYTYTDNGTYKLRLRVTDDGGATALSDLLPIEIVNHIPNCSFSWSPTAPTDAEDVTFTAVGNDIDGQVVGWRWNFGDGTTSSAYSPSHRFPDDGTYTVTLVVRDDDGEESRPQTLQITVINSPPIAAFSISTTSTQLGETVRFTDLSHDTSPTGQIVHVAWDFGDGTFCPGDGCGEGDIHTPIHIYTAPGTYTVRLSVIDDDGDRSWITRTLTITE